VPRQDCGFIGQILGERIVLNEFIGYIHLSEYAAANPGALAPRSITLASYALCGFANFASIAVQIGGIGALCPERRTDLAKIGLRAMFSGLLRGHGNKDVRRTHKVSNENTTKAVKEIRLFGDFGQNTIAFGDKDYGDVRREYGFLAYEYPFDEEGNESPLFRLEPIDPAEPVRLTILTAVPFDRLHIDMELRSHLLRKSAEYELEGRGNDAVERLRRQMLADEMKTRIGRNQRSCAALPKHRDGEFVVAIEQIEIFPEQPIKTDG